MAKSKIIASEPVKRDWDESGQVCFVDGYASGLDAQLRTGRIGTEPDVRAYIALNKTVEGFRPPLFLKSQQETNKDCILPLPNTKQVSTDTPTAKSSKSIVKSQEDDNDLAELPLFNATMGKKPLSRVRK